MAIAVDADALPDHRWVRGEAPTPQAVTEHDNRMRAWRAILFGQKEAPQRGSNAEHVEVVPRYELADHPFGPRPISETERLLPGGDQSRQHVVAVAQSGVRRIRENLGFASGVSDERHELIWLLDRQLANEHLVQQREDGGVGTNAQRQRH